MKRQIKIRNMFIRSRNIPKSIDEAQYNLISKHIDKVFYVKNNPGVGDLYKENKQFDHTLHYMQSGVVAGLDPHPNFSTSYYLKANPDVAKSDQNPFFHYINSGRYEGRDANASKIPVFINTKIPSDREQLLSISNTADMTEYYATIKSRFDERYYISSNSDLADALKKNTNIDLISHYISNGAKENRNPTSEFSTEHYMNLNSDVRRAGINPFYHYIVSGYAEGRSALPRIERHYPSLTLAPSVLFVSHAAQTTGAETMLRDMIEWYANNTCYNIDILVLEYGLMVESYAKYGNVYCVNGSEDLHSAIESGFLKDRYNLIYLNTVVSGIFSPIYNEKYYQSNVPVVLHIHEMREILEKYKDNLDIIRQNVHLYIAASDRVKEDLVRYFSIDTNQIHVFESFIKLNARSVSDIATLRSLARSNFGISDDEFVVLGAGIVSSRKGPDLFIDAIDKAIKRSKSQKIIGLWIGDGPEFNALRHWVSERGIEDSVRFVGYKQNARELIAAADLFFLSSREDPFPLVCLEAAQYAIPSIYFKGCTGIDKFTGIDAGRAIDLPTADAAASTIEYLISDQGLIDELGLNARVRVTKNNSQSPVMLKLFHFLSKHFDIKPTLSVIVPNYNHENFLAERINSIFKQGLQDIEIIILDDASTDKSSDVIARYESDPRVSTHFNLVGSGSAFHQWKKGLGLSRAPIVWIAESDDSCSNNFLSVLLPAFKYSGLNISYSRTVNIDENANVNEVPLDIYLREAANDKFSKSYFTAGCKDVETSMAYCCTIVNASGVLLRKSALLEAMPQSDSFRMCGDWMVYLHMLLNGSISYSIEATNFFRRHKNSIVSVVEGTDIYFEERGKVANYVLDNFYLSDQAANRILFEIEREWLRFQHIEKYNALKSILPKLRSDRSRLHSSSNLRHVAFYIHGLLFSKGGIERQGVEIANHLSRIGHKVTIFCRSWSSNIPVFDTDANIVVRPIFEEVEVQSSILRIREEIVKSGVEVFIPMLSEWLFDPILSAVDGLHVATIASEHNDPWVIEERWWNHQGRQDTFSKVDLIHLLLNKFSDSILAENRHKIRVIPNGVNVIKSRLDIEKRECCRIIAVGRLVEQKNFQTLVRAFSRLSKVYPAWELHIFGEGPERMNLVSLISNLGAEKKIFLRGETNDINSEMKISDFIVVPSVFEGFSIVVAEAKTVGLPAIAYVSCNGPNEIIHHGVDGLLCHFQADSDIDGYELSKVIQLMIEDSDLRSRLSDGALLNADEFSFERIKRAWENLVVEAGALSAGARRYD